VLGAVFPAAMLLTGGFGCTLEEVNSDAIRTTGLYVEMLAIAPGDGDTLVRVNLTVGGNSGTKVNLVGGDTLVAVSGSAEEQLVRRGDGRYEERLPQDDAGEITVRLDRPEQDASAQGIAFLPEPFAMQLETNDAIGIERSSPVVVSWQNPAAEASELEWSVEGDCIWSDSGITPDDGVMTLQPERVRVRGLHQGEECEVRITLDRSGSGDVDNVFIPGSSFRAIQRRAVSFLSTPGVGEKGGPPAAQDVSEPE
jgi:hypothetical protein